METKTSKLLFLCIVVAAFACTETSCASLEGGSCADYMTCIAAYANMNQEKASSEYGHFLQELQKLESQNTKVTSFAEHVQTTQRQINLINRAHEAARTLKKDGAHTNLYRKYEARYKGIMEQGTFKKIALPEFEPIKNYHPTIKIPSDFIKQHQGFAQQTAQFEYEQMEKFLNTHEKKTVKDMHMRLEKMHKNYAYAQILGKDKELEALCIQEMTDFEQLISAEKHDEHKKVSKSSSLEPERGSLKQRSKLSTASASQVAPANPSTSK